MSLLDLADSAFGAEVAFEDDEVAVLFEGIAEWADDFLVLGPDDLGVLHDVGILVVGDRARLAAGHAAMARAHHVLGRTVAALALFIQRRAFIQVGLARRGGGPGRDGGRGESDQGGGGGETQDTDGGHEIPMTPYIRTMPKP